MRSLADRIGDRRLIRAAGNVHPDLQRDERRDEREQRRREEERRQCDKRATAMPAI